MKKLALWLSILCIPLYGFWIFPQWGNWQDKKIERTQLDKKINDKSAEIKTLIQKQEIFKNENGEELLGKIPITLRQELLMIDLQRIVQKTGFNFKSLSFTKAQNPKVKAPELLINFSIQGSKSNIIDFLREVENNKRFMGLNGLNFAASEINGIEIVNMSASVYSFAQSEK